MAWYNDWDDFQNSGAGYALNPSMALGADTLGMGGSGGGLLGNRFDQAEQYGGMNPENFDLPGIGSAGQGGGGPRHLPSWLGSGESGGAGVFGWGGGKGQPRSGYDQFQDRYSDYLSQVQGRPAPTIGEYERAGTSGVAGQQQSLADMLAARARGENSIAELQLRQGLDRGMNQQRSLAAGARPGQSAMAGRLAAQNTGRMAADMGQQAAIARAQEAQMAAMGLGGLLGNMRGSDDEMARFNAAQNNQRQFGQAQMNQNQYSINDAANNALLGQSLNAAGMQQAGGIAQEQIAANRFGAALGVPTQQEVWMGGATAAAPALLASDERAKTNVRPGGQAADSFLGSLQPQQFSYKPGILPGELDKGNSFAGTDATKAVKLGVMAQDVASTPAGAQGVQQTSGGLMALDPTQLTGTVLAGLGRLNERLNALEGRGRGR